jgi:hypothetical protein
MTQRKEHSWNEWDYENRRTPVWVMMLTSASCCRHVQQDSECSFSVRQDSDISTQGTPPLYDVMSSTREDVIKRRHVLLRCTNSSLNHEWSNTASFVSCLDACLDAVGVRPPLYFEAEYGGNIFLRNVAWHIPDYTALHPQRQKLITTSMRNSRTT